MSRPPVRLFVDAPLHAGVPIQLPDTAAHYLVTVMRHGAGDLIEVFNGRDGAWRARITEAHRKRCTICPDIQSTAQEQPADLWLMCAPLKRERLNWTAEKACELGVAEFVPVQTARSLSERLNPDRLRAHMIEAAEQCGRTHVPTVVAMRKLAALLADWPQERVLLFCDETGGPSMWATLQTSSSRQWAILIGPEGGFTPEERTLLYAHPATVPVSLGPNILRADTAAVAAIALWQAARPDAQ